MHVYSDHFCRMSTNDSLKNLVQYLAGLFFNLMKYILFLSLILLSGGVMLHAQVEPIAGTSEHKSIQCIVLDSDNSKYVGTSEGLLKVGHDGQVQTILNGHDVTGVAWHKKTGVWAAMDGNTIYNPDSGVTIVLDGEDVKINSMDLTGSHLWVGTSNGLYVVSTSKARVTEHYTTSNSKLESNTINNVYCDESRIKWIATDRGVIRIENKKWKLYEKTEKIEAITSTDEGVWVSGTNEMWLVDGFNRWYPTGIAEGLSEGRVKALASDSKGRLYILSDIFIRFDPYSDEATPLENSYAAIGDAQVALVCDAEDRLWMGSLDQGLIAVIPEVQEVRELSAFVLVTHPQCNGENTGVISVTPDGGVAPYDISWSHTVDGEASVQELPPGYYGVTVTDAQFSEYSTEIRIEEPAALQVRILTEQELTAEGHTNAVLRADGSGGTGDYFFTWGVHGEGRRIEQVGAGTYNVTLTDQSGCATTAEFVLPDGPAIAVTAEPEISPTAEPLEAVDVATLQTLSVAALGVGQTLRIEQLQFEADSAGITENSYAVLDEIYTFLKSNDRVVIEIGGHTNGLPDHQYCDRLSTARAKTVANYLYGKGIPENRIAFKGYGKREPVATNDTIAGRRQNQRVEIKILEI